MKYFHLRFTANRIFFLLLIIAACGYGVDAMRPIDGSSNQWWREPDVGGIARNYYREDMNFLLPRIDWRGDGPGYVESEFPIYPWAGALLYKIFGYHEPILRWISLIISLCTAMIFFRLASLLLSEKAAVLAAAFFLFHPLFGLIATSVQPEALMFFGYVLSIYSFLKWIDTKETSYYILAIASTTLAILAKAPAAHVTILFVCLSFYHFGWRALKNSHLWLFAIITLGLPMLWYLYAHQLWLEYGNSLGMSNEGFVRIFSTTLNEFISARIVGVLSSELRNIWLFIGIPFGFIGFLFLIRTKQKPIILFWTFSLIIFYLVTGGTTGQGWASYYHIVTLPLASILIAQGFVSLVEESLCRIRSNSWKIPTILTICVVFSLLFLYEFDKLGHRVVNVVLKKSTHKTEYETAEKFKKLANAPGLIIASGVSSTDELGRSVAANPSYYFFWMDRKGFNLHANDQNMETLLDYKNRGARYFVIERRYLNTAPDFYNEVFSRFRVVSQTDDAILVDLSQPDS